MTERWNKWKPINELSSDYHIDAIFSGVERIVYKDPIPFQDSVDTPDYMRKILSGATLKKESYDWFVIILSESINSQHRIRMTFEDALISYRSTKVKYRTELIGELEKQYGNWAFFKVENSLYLKWLLDQSYEIISSDSVQFSLVASNLILDVVTSAAPRVELIND